MNIVIHCWRYNCKKLVRKKSAREVVAVQVRVDSVEVGVSWSSRLIFVVTVWLLGAGYMAQGARADPLKLPTRSSNRSNGLISRAGRAMITLPPSRPFSRA